MKTYKQFNESITRALVKFGSKGLRKIATQAVKTGVSRKIISPDVRRLKLDKLITKQQKNY